MKAGISKMFNLLILKFSDFILIRLKTRKWKDRIEFVIQQ